MGSWDGSGSLRKAKGASSPRTSHRTFASRLLIAVVSMLVTPVAALGFGEERTSVGDDLSIRTDTRWAGGAVGGYLPVRVEVANQAEARSLVFEVLPSNGAHGATVRRVVGVGEDATVRFTLAIPLVGFRQGMLRVSDQRGGLPSHSRVINGPNRFGVQLAPAMLVVSSRSMDCSDYLSAVGNSHPVNRFGNFGGTDTNTLADVVPPDSLPDSWIDYSGLDFVAISRDDLAGLEPSVRAAILKWVHCGGNLIVFRAGRSPQEVETLDQLLELDGQAKAGAGWSKPEGLKARSSFETRELMLGLLCKFPGELPDTALDWSTLLGRVGEPRSSWLRRHGVAPDIGTDEFYNFMNPGIRGVPVYGFMVLITGFAVLIGPVNYFYLRRKRLLWLLLVTVPVMAIATSSLLLGYSVAAHGFSVRSRTRSLTVLDQKSHSAVTVERLSLFAGVAPARGLTFSPETAVYPVFPSTAEPGALAVEWTDNQSLTSGWLLSRTRTQFLTIRHSEQTARVDVKPTQGGGLAIVNGLPQELEAILVADTSGQLYSGRNVLPNATATLTGITKADRSDFVQLLGRNRPELPDNFSPPLFNPLVGRSPRAFRVMMAGSSESHFDSNLMERLIRQWSQDLSAQKTCLPPRSYLAVLRRDFAGDTGVGPTTEQAGYHLLFGYY